MTHRLDIVLLVLDAQRADHLSCYGYPTETSPYLDLLATDSTLFTNAVAPAQWTIPSHASMFTGLYPLQHAMFQPDSRLSVELPTLAERLRLANYFTVGFSSNPLIGILDNGLRRGFDSFWNYGGLLTLKTNQVGAPIRLPFHLGESLIESVVKRLSRVQNVLPHSYALQKFWFSQPIVSLVQGALRIKGNLKGDIFQCLTDATRLLIERPSTEPNQPIFAFINLMGTHFPFNPPRWAMERFAPELGHSPADRFFLWGFNAQIYRWLGPLARSLNPESRAMLNSLYDAAVAAQDEQVNLFIEHLRAAGLLEKMLLIVVADHGELLGEKQLLGHAFSAYEQLVHVPLLVRDPLGNLPRGVTLTPVVSIRRLFHTALTAAGAATPSEEALALVHLGSSDPDQGIVFVEAEPLWSAIRLTERRRPGLLRALGYNRPHRAIYCGTHKLIAIGETRRELYDVREDPHERTDLARALPKQADRMLQRLRDFLRQTHDSATDPAQLDDRVRRRLKALGYFE